MLNARNGSRSGHWKGSAVGSIADDEALSESYFPGISIDSIADKYCPASNSEWTDLLAAASITTGNPSALYLCQEPSGNLADSIGIYTLAVTGAAFTYNQPVTGWARFGIQCAAALGGGFSNTDVTLPDVSTTSMMMMMYLKPSANAANRSLFGLSPAATRLAAELTLTTGTSRLVDIPNTVTGTVDTTGQVRPWILNVNRATSTCNIYTDLEKTTGAIGGSITGQKISVGILQNNCTACQYVYGCVFFGPAAEQTDGQIRTMLQTLRWNPLW